MEIDNMKILESLEMRPGMPGYALLKEYIEECRQDLKDLLHVEELGTEHDSILKEMVLIKVNCEGAQGISGESRPSVSTTYLDDLPKSLRRKIAAKRKLPR